MKKFSKKEIFSIPNIMGYFRILLIPVFCYLYITAESREDYMWAAFVVLISSLTDLFDGKIARRFNMITELGKALDPVADKLTHAALAVCLATRYPLMWILIALMAVKEGYMGIMGILFLRKGKMLDGAMWFGKVCTALLFVGLLVLFLFPALPEIFVNILITVMMAVMAITLLLYIPVFRKMKEEK
ncbi:MAG: CDP-alcohol phosphatidyltransferase family protein [Eubacteriales bacterium]|nr:CDP-alcohol phosphatidyltransferase family protein [Eubacteriales bacterium]